MVVNTERLVAKTHLAGLYVAHLIASANEQPVNSEKFLTHLSSVTTLQSTKS
jgi:hypothetical protein